MSSKYEALEMYTAGMRVPDIAEELGISVPSVYKLLDVRNLTAQIKKDKIAEAIRMYKDTDIPVAAICKSLNLSPPTLYASVRAAGLSRRESKRTRTIAMQERNEDIVDLYELGMTIRDIGDMYHASPPVIYAILRDYGIKPNRRNRWL